jgi:hypothetical protein
MGGTVLGLPPPGTRGNLARVTEPSSPPGSPAALRWAIGVLAVEAAGVGVIAGWLVYEAATSTGRRNAWSITGFAIAVAAVLALFGWALARRMAWARGPSIVLELMLVPIGYYMIKGNLIWLGVPVVLLGLFGAGLLLAPATREGLGAR